MYHSLACHHLGLVILFLCVTLSIADAISLFVAHFQEPQHVDTLELWSLASPTLN